MEFQGNNIQVRVTDSVIRMESVVGDAGNVFSIVQVGNRFLLRTRPNATVTFAKIPNVIRTRSDEPNDNFTFRSDEEGNVELGEVDSGVYRVSVDDSEPETVVMAKSEAELPKPILDEDDFKYYGANDFRIGFIIDTDNYADGLEVMLGNEESDDIISRVYTEFFSEFTAAFNSNDLDSQLHPGTYYAYNYVGNNKSEYITFDLGNDGTELPKPTLHENEYYGDREYEFEFRLAATDYVNGSRIMLGNEDGDIVSNEFEIWTNFYYSTFSSDWMSEALPRGKYYAYTYIVRDDGSRDEGDRLNFDVGLDADE